jgi:hypothetical protein
MRNCQKRQSWTRRTILGFAVSLLTVGSGLSADPKGGTNAAGGPAQGHTQQREVGANDKGIDGPGGDAVKLAMRQWKGQVKVGVGVARGWPHYDFVCIADRVDFDEAESTLRLWGHVLVEGKDKPQLYAGERVVVYPKTKTIDVLQNRVTPAVESTAKANEAAKVEKLWADQKVEFLIRMSPRIDVVTIKENAFNTAPNGSAER